MSDRAAEARAEAERQADHPWSYTSQKAAQVHAFTEGVVWADANPKPRTITRAGFEARFMPDVTVAMNVLGFLRELGIEVEGDDE